jgi:ATP-dependent helicase/nuclease subunit B
MRRDAGRDAAPLLAALKRCTDGFVKLVRRKRVGLAELLRAHVAMAEALAETDEASGAARLWAGDAGEAAARFVADVDGAAGALGHLAGADYAALLDTLMTGRVVRPRFGLHPRLHVWGLLEARLQHTDVMILGGLNEDTWPPAVDASPWMSRPMMRQFGLPLPERRIGLAAHDFCQAFSAPEVVLTRAARVEGTPTVPSRWLLRLENGLVGTPLEGALAPDRTVAAWFAQLDAAHDFRPVAPPAPLPPVAARPRALSVTRVETWVRDPYAVYAERILGLEPLDPIDADPGAAERGSIVHRALELFLETHAEALPEDPYAALVAIGETVFAGTMERPGVRAFWWPRFLRMAGWFADWEAARRAGGTVTVGFEASAELSLAAPAGPFVLRAKADRIDRRPDGRLAILDYKTGEAPSAPQVESGLAPQLSLEAAMARLGAFTDVAAAEVAELAYVRLSGGRMPGEEKRLKLDPAAVADEALARLSSRVALFDDAATPYLSRPHPKFIDHAGAYDHLARVGEWVAGGTP